MALERQRPIVERPTARVIAIDALGRVLLFQIQDVPMFDPFATHPAVPRVFWITPGGGVDPGESFEEAARRELREETGLLVESLGPCLLEEEFSVPRADRDIQFRIHYFLARVPGGAISLDGLDATARGVYRDHRWWTIAALETTEETVYPGALSRIVRTFVKPACA